MRFSASLPMSRGWRCRVLSGDGYRWPAVPPGYCSKWSSQAIRPRVVAATHEVLGDPSHLQVPLFEQIPAEALVFIYPSRFCQSDLLARLAKREFNQDESGFYRVTRVCNWISERIEYLSGTTTPTTSAFDTVTQLAGVCRDFAHLAIAFCRSLGIPARFVSAYAYGLNLPDFHVYIEAFLGGRWAPVRPNSAICRHYPDGGRVNASVYHRSKIIAIVGAFLLSCGLHRDCVDQCSIRVSVR